MLADGEIRALIENGALNDADPQRVGPVSYDLRNEGFYTSAGRSSSVILSPGESVFVASAETVALPPDVSATVALKNSRIRQGLAIASPVYFPGHKTRLFYRVTNVSADQLELGVEANIAQVMFERLAQPVGTPYSGAFQNEFDYRGLASYSDIYGAETRKLDKKADRIEGMEQRIYGNVVAIMGVFVAIFSLVNLDLSWISSSMPVSTLLVLDLTIVGGMAALVGLIATLMNRKDTRVRYLPWVVAIIAFLAAAIMLVCLK